MPTPRFVYFDLGNVLLQFSHQLAARQMAEVAGIDAAAAWSAVFESPLQEQLELGRIDDLHFHREFSERTGSRSDPQALIEAASAIFWLNAPMLPLVAQLAAAGTAVGILSNTCDAHWRYVVRRFPALQAMFRVRCLSFEIGAMKPDQAIYERAAELAGCAAAEIFFTDDRPENVAGAVAAGWSAHLFRDPVDLAAALRGAGLRFNF